ncbi:uncharacterized protein N7479_004967 [Penicillium vulpinum]|uniref:uncharacterized protein n=1 Tax=Penicillium vulpinum TaxID=29845 RepID=UPI00254658C1|nr:uncharacterized protein N7479_004967 [Penicillium vulpinum]KAJ5965091.1 hypothetical protein N7479_004967 [Penicillium vulpinum]
MVDIKPAKHARMRESKPGLDSAFGSSENLAVCHLIEQAHSVDGPTTLQSQALALYPVPLLLP